jgi:hypothetical protein
LTGSATFSFKKLHSYPHGAEWTPFQTHYSENLVAPGTDSFYIPVVSATVIKHEYCKIESENFELIQNSMANTSVTAYQNITEFCILFRIRAGIV